MCVDDDQLTSSGLVHTCYLLKLQQLFKAVFFSLQHFGRMFNRTIKSRRNSMHLDCIFGPYDRIDLVFAVF